MTTTQKTREQEMAEAKARHERFVAAAIEKFDGILADLRTQLADLGPSAITRRGFNVGDVRVEIAYHPSYSFGVQRRAPDRITVCYTERRFRRSKRKTLTYTKVDETFVARLTVKLREIVGELAQARLARVEAEQQEHDARVALEARLAPLQSEVAAFNTITGTARFDATLSERFKLTIDVRDAGDVVAVLQALLQVVIAEGPRVPEADLQRLARGEDIRGGK